MLVLVVVYIPLGNDGSLDDLPAVDKFLDAVADVEAAAMHRVEGELREGHSGVLVKLATHQDTAPFINRFIEVFCTNIPIVT